MNRPPSFPTFLCLAALLPLFLMPGCGDGKASRFYEDPDPITAPSSTPPVQAAADTAPDAQPFQVSGDKVKPEEEKPEDEAEEDTQSTEESGEETTEKPETAESGDEETSTETTGSRKQPEKPASKPRPITSPGASVPPAAETPPKRTLPRNSNVVTPGDGASASQPSRLPVKQNLDSSQPKPKTIQPEPQPKPQEAPAKKQPEKIIAPVDLAPMNPAGDDDLPPPPKPSE